MLKIIETGLRERDKAQIGLKWPLAKAIISCEDKISKELEKIIVRQLNVKKIDVKKDKELKVELDLKMTPELEAEGYAREISRAVQAERKKAGLVKGDLIELEIVAGKDFCRKIETQKDILKERTNCKTININDKKEKNYKNEANIVVKNISLNVYFSKL